MAENKTEVVPVRLPPTLARRVRKMARQDGRKLSEWFRELAHREAAERDAERRAA